MKQTTEEFLRKVPTLLIRSGRAIIRPPGEYIVIEIGKRQLHGNFSSEPLCVLPHLMRQIYRETAESAKYLSREVSGEEVSIGLLPLSDLFFCCCMQH